MRGFHALTALLAAGAGAVACQLFLDERGPPADPSADGGGAADGGTNDSGSSDASTPPCGLGASVLRFELEGSAALLVSDGDGAYFTEQLADGGAKISSVATLRDGGLEYRSIAFPGAFDEIRVLWPDPNKAGFLRYIADGPSGRFFKVVDKGLATLDEAFIAAAAALRYEASGSRMVMAQSAVPSPGIVVGFADPQVAFGFDPIATLGGTVPVHGLTSDGVAAYMSSSIGIHRLDRDAATVLADTSGGGAPRGSIAVMRGVVYWLSGNEIFSVSAAGGPRVPLGVNPNAIAIAVDDTCLFVANGDEALLSLSLDGGQAAVVATDVGSVAQITASKRGVFWTTGFPSRIYALLRPVPQ